MIASDDGLLPVRRQTIIWISAGLLLIVPLGTNFNEILISVENFSFSIWKYHLQNGSQFGLIC